MNALCWSPPESSRNGASTRSLEPDASDRAGDRVTVGSPQRAEHATRCQPAGRYHFTHGRGRVAPEQRPLGQVSDAGPTATAG